MGASDLIINGHSKSSAVRLPHPLDQLNAGEIQKAREIILQARGQKVIDFRCIFTEEPPKKELVEFLKLEHSGSLSAESPHPARCARVQYDVINGDKSHDVSESVIDLDAGREISHQVLTNTQQPSFTPEEFSKFTKTCFDSPLFKEAIAKFKIPEGFVIEIDPWPYGGPDPGEKFTRYTQGLCFARDASNNNPDSNHYGYPIPIIPVMDTFTGEVIRVDKLATGGKEDGLAYGTHSAEVLKHCGAAEYVPELLDIPLRTDLKPLNVIQPDGPSFKVSDESLIEWQKWRFRVGFNPREGATLHDIHYDGRSLFYRLSFSEMTVPYGDPRPPFHRKQAFDFGDGGAGQSANNLALGCDCLGVIKYLDTNMVTTEGHPSLSKNVVCIHEQDNGIGWKHTNFRTNRAVVTRARELVVQFIITLANYEYIFAYKFSQAGDVTFETRATGIVSVVNIDPGKTSPWGKIVSPGALAQNHQHIFALRIDPAIDGHRNTIIKEESLPIPMSPDLNPWGNGYQVLSTPIKTSTHLDASPQTNLTIKITNPHNINPISRTPVAYKFIPSATQLLLADPNSIVAKRAQFAQHHLWVTSYKDNEFFAGGRYTSQSQEEIEGVADAVARKDNVQDTDVVIYSVFGLTHNPRVEDWPVMPMEKHELHLRPADFFTRNPAIDVPGNRNLSSVLVGENAEIESSSSCCANGTNGGGEVQNNPATHWQSYLEYRPAQNKNGTGTAIVNGHYSGR